MQSKRYNNPVRRSKNIGTAKQGRGQNNRHVVPQSWSWNGKSVFYEELRDAVIIPVNIGAHTFRIFIEPTNNGYVHPCIPDDLVRVFSLIPELHRRDIEIIALRQPSKKEELLKPTWGRMAYFANVGKYSGPGIFLTACQPNFTIKWPKSIMPEDEKELKLLKEHGHTVSSGKRNIIITTSVESWRNTQLYFTLPHEVGHYVHYIECVINPIQKDNELQDKDKLEKHFFAKEFRDKESYANQYARKFYSKMKKQGVLPFPRVIDENKIKEQGMKIEWFVP